jgi:hypothetical protein
VGLGGDGWGWMGRVGWGWVGLGGAGWSPEAVGTLTQENKIFTRAAHRTQVVLLNILSLHCLSLPGSADENMYIEQWK